MDARKSMMQKCAQYMVVQPQRPKDDGPSLWKNLLGGAVAGAGLAGLGAGGYGAYKGYQDFKGQKADYLGGAHPMGFNKSRQQVMDDVNAPPGMREKIQSGVPGKWGPIGKGAWQAAKKPMLYGLGAGALAGLLRYFLVR